MSLGGEPLVSAPRTPALFLDRDGTINVDIGPEYVSCPGQIRLIPGVAVAIASAQAAGYRIAMITNQAGVAKGKTPGEALPLIHRRIEELIAEAAGLAAFAFDDIRVCTHHPDERCRCRKPETLMLEESIARLHADVERSLFIGDKMADLECAAGVGMRSILVLTGHGGETEAACAGLRAGGPIGIVPSLVEAVAVALAAAVQVAASAR